MIPPQLLIAVVESHYPGTIHGKDFSIVRAGGDWQIGRWIALQPRPENDEIRTAAEPLVAAWVAIATTGALPVLDSETPSGVRAITAEEQFSRLTLHEKLGVIFSEMPPAMRAKCYAIGMTHAWDRQDYEVLRAMVETYAPQSPEEQNLQTRALACLENTTAYSNVSTTR